MPAYSSGMPPSTDVPMFVTSACNGYKDDGVFIAAASDVVFAKRRACGREYFVVCLGGVNKGSNPCKHHSAVVVKIVDHCPPSCRSTISLSQEAFSVLADPSVGRVRIAYVDYNTN
ncbi:EG45-like domain containing protein [Morella rubra]|uniref:EG45-like domain containing protein n=1 Tax=Morella rubra TaxID=262757 RepID=A0A6A1UXG9_9ROSI|nr:EG45-like domain containing protein [Morella rubra]